jgi:hypothetical protein
MFPTIYSTSTGITASSRVVTRHGFMITSNLSSSLVTPANPLSGSVNYE